MKCAFIKRQSEIQQALISCDFSYVRSNGCLAKSCTLLSVGAADVRVVGVIS